MPALLSLRGTIVNTRTYGIHKNLPGIYLTIFTNIFLVLLTLLELQSRFGENWGQITWNLSALSPKRDWSSKGVNYGPLVIDVYPHFNPRLRGT